MNWQICRNIGAILALVVMAPSREAAAEILFDNGAPVSGSYVENADIDDPFDLTEAGTVFTPAAGKAVDLTFAGAYLGGTTPAENANDFKISIYLTSGGAPAGNAVLTTNLDLISMKQIAGFSTKGGLPVYSFTGTLDLPYTFAASTSYYLGISDVGDGEDFGVTYTNPGVSTDEQSYYSGPAGNQYYTQGFNQSTDPLSFSISTPEPHVWALEILSTFVLILAARWRARNLRA